MEDTQLAQLIIDLSTALHPFITKDSFAFMSAEDKATADKVWKKISTYALENS